MSYKYFENRSCEYYPCHKIENINCLFCYCPLYLMEDCGGNYRITESGIKDCSNCVFPHIEANYDKVIAKFKIAAAEKREAYRKKLEEENKL